MSAGRLGDAVGPADGTSVCAAVLTGPAVAGGPVVLLATRRRAHGPVR
ncbi:hypothetical protein [Streptomyces sp. NPDC008092]